MKNLYKLLYLSVFIFAVGCINTNDDDRFLSDPLTGWVEFQRTATTTGQTSPEVSVTLNLEVPMYPDGLDIYYSITAVEGNYTQFNSSTGGTISVTPDNRTGIAVLTLPLAGMDVGRDFVTSFDIELTGTSIPGVTVGIGSERTTVHRVTIPCSNPDVLDPTYFVGDYLLEDVVGTIGPGNGTVNFSNTVVSVTVDPADPNGRLFSVPILPAFRPGPVDFKIRFDENDFVTLDGEFSTSPGLSCNGLALYTFTGQSAENAGPWDVCNDQFLIVEYTEDPRSACGGPYGASFSMTKQ